MDAFLSELFDVCGVDHVPFLDPATGSLSHEALMRDPRLVCNAAFRFAWRTLSGGSLPSARCYAECVCSIEGNATTCGAPPRQEAMVEWMLKSREGPFYLMKDTPLMSARVAELGDGRLEAYITALQDRSSQALHRSLVEKLMDRHAPPAALQVADSMSRSLFMVYTDLTRQTAPASILMQLTNLASGMVASHEEEREHADGTRATACKALRRVSRGDAVKRRFSRDLHFQRRQFGRPYVSAPAELMKAARVVSMAIGAPWVVDERDALEVEQHSPVIASVCVRLHRYGSAAGVRLPAPSSCLAPLPSSLLILFGEGTDAELAGYGRAHGYQRILRASRSPSPLCPDTTPLVYSLYFGPGGSDHWTYGILATALRRHLATPCPLDSLDPMHAHLLVDRCLTRLALSREIFASVPKVFAVSPMGIARRVILAIDTRADPSATVLSVAIALSSLARTQDWAVRMMCSRRNRSECERMMRPLCQNATFDDSFPELNRETFDVETSYNALMKNPATWRSLLPSDVVLTIQDDGLLVRPGVEALLDQGAVYLGAPWADAAYNRPLKTMVPSLVGNGGLSLRNVRAMLAMSEGLTEQERRRLFHNRIEPIPEDVMYAALAAQLPSQAAATTAKILSCEQVPFAAALGFHKPWPYWLVSDTHAHMESLLISEHERGRPTRLDGAP